jgi:hypothetical protein
LFVDGLGKFLLEEHDDFLNILAGDHLHSKAESLSPDIDVRAAENTQGLHGQVIQNTLIANSQLVHAVQTDKLHVVVGFPDGELNQLARGSFNGDGVAGEGGKRCGGFVNNSTCRGIEELEHELQVS